MAIRLRDRQVDPWIQPGGRLISLPSTAMKWTGLLLTCVNSLGIAVFQRGLLKMDTYATIEDFTAAVADPANGLMGLASTAAACVLIAAMALPLYAKLIYEGWKRVTDKKTFFLRLALCALVSEIPYDLAINGRLLEFDVQNPAWSLLLCAAMLEVLHIPKPRSKIASALLQAVTVAGALAWAVLLRFYLGTSMVLLAALFYFLEGNRSLSTLGGVLFTMPQFPAPFGMLFVHWYEPNEEKDAKLPNLFYILYPVQLLVFGIVGLVLANLP
ncbi:MAG: conjugal transfer protein TraX [Oscillospiraceae bacterium]|nr:conjugal transfer protein TraX [Oscillospiraceae bacterium]